jgi:hypothetical protein
MVAMAVVVTMVTLVAIVTSGTLVEVVGWICQKCITVLTFPIL